MTTTLISICPTTGAEIRTPWRSPSGRDDMERAAERLKQGRDHDRCGRKPCLRCVPHHEHPDCPRKAA